MNRATVDAGACVVDQPDDFRVSLDAYRGEALFQAEMDRIFSSTWVYLGHDSEIPEPGDYVLRWAGTQSVIMARDDQGRIRFHFVIIDYVAWSDVGEAVGNHVLEQARQVIPVAVKI